VLLAIGLTWALIRSSGFLQGLEAWRAAAFAVISAITSTGFMDEDFTHWPSVLPVLLIYLSCIGGCAGSTAGGIKIVRCIVLARQGALEVLRLVHPNLVRTLKHDGRAAAASLGCRLGVLFCLRTVLRAADGDLSHERARLYLSLRCSCDHAE
jgi:trk system potassium uptake protein TrkH